jgi:hypothetical protein
MLQKVREDILIGKVQLMLRIELLKDQPDMEYVMVLELLIAELEQQYRTRAKPNGRLE